MMIYIADTIHINMPVLRWGSLLATVKTGKQSLFAITHFPILTHNIYLLVQAQKSVLFGLKAAVKNLLDIFFKKIGYFRV